VIRGHLATHNVCHGSLDVTWGEDACRIPEGYAAENLSLGQIMVLGSAPACGQAFQIQLGTGIVKHSA